MTCSIPLPGPINPKVTRRGRSPRPSFRFKEPASENPMSGIPCGIRSIFSRGTPYVSRRISTPLRAITTRRLLREINSSITLR